MITLDDYYMGRDKQYPQELTDELCRNAATVVERVNRLLARAGLARGINSGWRPPAVNAAVEGASARSRHLTCQAIDIADDDDALDAWCMAHLEVLEALGLWLEHPDATPRWCHLQIVPPASGNRVFEP